MIKRSDFVLITFLIVISLFSSCGIYKFNDVTLDPEIRTVRVQFIENKARIQNPQLSPRLTDRLRQKIVSQTRLTQTNSDEADYNIYAEITDYSVTTSGVSGPNGQQQASLNRLTVSLRVVGTNQKKNEDPKEITVSRSFDFRSNLSLQQAENSLLDEMVRTLTDEIFNQLFSNW